MSKHNDQLLPCPFCGDPNPNLTHDDYVHDDLRPMPVVECTKCHTWVRAEAWNTRAQLPAGGEVPKLNKTREQWERVDSRFCAENNSPAANMHLIKDAQQDIARLHRALAAAPHPVSGEQSELDEYRFAHIEIDGLLMGAVDFDITHEGNYKAALLNTLGALRKLIGNQTAAQDVSGLCELIDDVCEWFELRGLHDLNIYKTLKAAHRAQAQGGEAKPECKCSMRTRLVGDGCSVCNPYLAAEYAKDDDV